MAKKPMFSWDEEEGTASCILTDGKNNFIGIAMCDPDDEDMKSEKTGCEIALYRAEIQYYTHLKNNEIQPALQALKQLYYSMNRSKKFDPKSYENRMLQRQIHQKEDELVLVNKLLTDKKQELKDYIERKEQFYRQIRRHRIAPDLVGQKSSK